MGIYPLYARRRAVGIGIRIHLLSAALLVRSPEGRRVYCMCIIPRGTTLVVLLHRRGRIARSSSPTFRRGRNPVIGLQGPGGLHVGIRSRKQKFSALRKPNPRTDLGRCRQGEDRSSLPSCNRSTVTLLL